MKLNGMGQKLDADIVALITNNISDESFKNKYDVYTYKLIKDNFVDPVLLLMTTIENKEDRDKAITKNVNSRALFCAAFA